MLLTKTKMKLGLMLFFAASTGANAQYNVDYKMGQYADPQTIESNVDIGKDELITVGTLKVNDFVSSHDDVVLTRLNKDGKVLWNIRYGRSGLDEVGNGITLSWDKKHVIVVGSVHKTGDEELKRQALVMKVRISDGAVVWTTTHGIDGYDDQAFLVKRSTSFEDEAYVIVGASSGDPGQSFERMYAFKIKDSGHEIWSRRYYLSYNFPIRSIRPTSMVENGYARFMIAGTRAEVNRPTQIFSVGISDFNGAVTDDLHHYPTSSIYHVSTVDIDRHPDGKGYGLSFTANDFRGDCLVPADFDTDTDRIGVIRLNEDRKVLWSNVYWENKATNHNGLSIRFYKDELHVCININRKTRYNTPGILRLKEVNGGVISANTYHIPEFLTDYGPLANHMIRTSNEKEYYIKSIYQKWGFSMVNTDVIGRANCDKETRIYSCAFKTEPKAEKCEAKEYGKYKFTEIPTKKVDYSEDHCEDGFGLEKESQEDNQEGMTRALPINKAMVYPSPVGENQALVNLQFITDMDEAPANISIYNSMGQQVLNLDFMLINGENKFQFDANQFTSGIYMVTISTQGEMIDRVKFVKN